MTLGELLEQHEKLLQEAHEFEGMLKIVLNGRTAEQLSSEELSKYYSILSLFYQSMSILDKIEAIVKTTVENEEGQ